ncbi:MAG: hypothetical protein GF364_09575 [Candidatus Lokiarchaeota archaeon]|nr:hypothetical protein [Candidatus Lokiarchaeota archaeon]
MQEDINYKSALLAEIVRNIILLNPIYTIYSHTVETEHWSFDNNDGEGGGSLQWTHNGKIITITWYKHIHRSLSSDSFTNDDAMFLLENVFKWFKECNLSEGKE